MVGETHPGQAHEHDLVAEPEAEPVSAAEIAPVSEAGPDTAHETAAARAFGNTIVKIH